jgi:signal transduction histidine kinase
LETARRYWKRFEGWAIDFHNKYWGDIFFRTELNVIFLQIAFAIVLSVTIIVFFNYLYKDILQTVLQGITAHIQSNGSITSADIVDSIQVVKDKNFFLFFGIAMCLTLLFSYIIAKATLSPTRNALKTQKRFISDVAHELRTPIAIIKTNNEVALLDEPKGSVAEVFRDTVEELDRVSAIINNLLTFNNLVHPEPMQFGVISMGDVIDSSIHKLDDLIRKKDPKLIIKKIAPFTVWGNTVALEQIVINIVKNAINYSQAGGAVAIRVEPDYRGNVIFTVEDSGIGIAQDDLLHIFEPFYRAERSRNRQSGSSSGLGLTIVSELVKLHHGKISVKSRVRQGTAVAVSLPYAKSAEAEEFSADEDTEKDEVSVDFLHRE